MGRSSRKEREQSPSGSSTSSDSKPSRRERSDHKPHGKHKSRSSSYKRSQSPEPRHRNSKRQKVSESSSSDSERSGDHHKRVKARAKTGRSKDRRIEKARDDHSSSSDISSERHRRKVRKRRKRKQSSSSSDSEDRHRPKKHGKEKGRRRHKKRQKKGGKTEGSGGVDVPDDPAKVAEMLLFNKKEAAILRDAEELAEMTRRNAEAARASLASGEFAKARDAQVAAQNALGVNDWRARKKLIVEKKRLSTMVKAGKRLEEVEARETARMDAFRAAMGLPSAEAQRQAEWRAEATRAALEAEALEAMSPTSQDAFHKRKRTLGPTLGPQPP